ncbi:RDD family protein [Metabacillus indicus]|uniref:RDD family protein n=1 Tax=Metabacillus indicus TaxID=246786 RepID=UPI00068C08E9|nr:RDD family protein [Metabacillus indicus]
MNEQRPAGFWIRFAAATIDGLITNSVLILPSIFLLVSGVREGLIPGILGFLTLALLIGTILYFGMMPATSFQGTLGKKMLGLKVVNDTGGKISMGQSWIRYLGYIVSSIFYIGYIMAAFTDRKRALHDMMADTYVVKAEPDLQVASEKRLQA